MADGAMAQAKEYALDALDGDAKAQARALEYRAESKAYVNAAKAWRRTGNPSPKRRA